MLKLAKVNYITVQDYASIPHNDDGVAVSNFASGSSKSGLKPSIQEILAQELADIQKDREHND